MLAQRRQTLAFKTSLIYILVTILNITVFILMVFENQTDLISRNAVLNSEEKGISFKSRVDQVLAGKNELDNARLNQILKEAKFLGIQDLSLFEENGDIRMEVREGRLSDRKNASPEEIKWISKAITKGSFEDKAFTPEIRRAEKTVRLFIPVHYGVDKIAILSPIVPMLDIDEQMGYLYKQCGFIGLFLIVIHTAMGMFLSRLIVRPIARLNEASMRIAQGDLQSRVEILRNDEIGQLAISFNEMTVALARMQDEAKGANPLTGLPGNLVITKEIERRLATEEKFAVMYCDLDNFKAYNDKYGFSKGDEVILHSKTSLTEAARKKGEGKVFIGHEGGDDFVMVAGISVWEEVTKYFISNFDYGIPHFYNETDKKNGFIESVNRQGVPMRFPLISVSVAVVSNERRRFTAYSEMVSVAAEMKKFVKSKEGSCYAIDRRKDPPPEGYPVKPLPAGTNLPNGPFPPGVKPSPVYNGQAKTSPGRTLPA